MTTRPDHIDAEMANEHLAAGRAVFLDARPRAAYQGARTRIPGALHVAPGTGAALDAALERLPRGLLIIAYCDEPAHAASAQVARRARELGRGDASVLDGGLRGWVATGLPVEAFPSGGEAGQAEAASLSTLPSVRGAAPGTADAQPPPPRRSLVVRPRPMR